MKTPTKSKAPLTAKTQSSSKKTQSILVGARTGGQGKTLYTRLLAHAAYLQNYEFDIISIDSVDDGTSAGSTSKLARLLPDVRQFAIAPRLSEVVEKGVSAVEHWDALGERLEEGNCLVDIGANVISSIFDWARESEIGDHLQPMTLIIPVTRQAQSAADATAVIEEAAELRQHFPIQRIVIGFNDVHGKVSEAQGPDFANLRKRMQSERIVACHVDRCVSEIWEHIETSQQTLSQLAAMTDEEFQIAFNLGRFPARRGNLKFKKWLDEHVRRFAAIGLPLGDDEIQEMAAATSGFDS